MQDTATDYIIVGHGIAGEFQTIATAVSDVAQALIRVDRVFSSIGCHQGIADIPPEV